MPTYRSGGATRSTFRRASGQGEERGPVITQEESAAAAAHNQEMLARQEAEMAWYEAMIAEMAQAAEEEPEECPDCGGTGIVRGGLPGEDDARCWKCGGPPDDDPTDQTPDTSEDELDDGNPF